MHNFLILQIVPSLYLRPSSCVFDRQDNRINYIVISLKEQLSSFAQFVAQFQRRPMLNCLSYFFVRVFFSLSRLLCHHASIHPMHCITQRINIVRIMTCYQNGLSSFLKFQ